MVEVQQGHEAPLLRHRHVDERLGADALEVVGGGAGARILVGVLDHDRLAALEFVDVAAVVAEVQQTGKAADARGVPVPIDADGFGGLVDGPVADAADPQFAPEQFTGGVGKVIRIGDVADAVAELRQGGRAALGGMGCGDVVAFAKHAGNLAGIVVERRVDEGQIAQHRARFGRGLEFHRGGVELARAASGVDLVQRLEEPLPCDRGESLAHGAADPVTGVEDFPVRVVDELDDVIRAPHDDDESGRLFEQPPLSLLLQRALLIGPVALGDVGGRAEPLHDLTLRAQQRHRGRFQPADTTIGAGNAVFAVKGRPGPDRCLYGGADGVLIFRQHQGFDPVACR